MAADQVVELDVRGLEPPEPLEKALRCAAALEPGQVLHLLIHREPFPLYEMLQSMGYRYETQIRADGNYLVIVRCNALGR